MASQTLSSSQAHALFDILTHHEAYAEIQALKESQNVAEFGPPLQPGKTSSSSSPLLRLLIDRFILVLPGLRDVSPEFWTVKIHGLATALDDANLSESYDKGSIGIRKTLSTAIAAMVEYVSRGCLGGYAPTKIAKDREYDTSNPDDVIAAWDDLLQQVVYGDALDRIFAKAAETDKLSEHESVVQAAHEYIFVIMGSFVHYILIVSPRGQSMLELLIKANNMLPYFLIRQTLRVGNAASMLSGMVKLVLAKMNITSVTSWFGAQQSDSGMNLMQQIISTVLGWDNTALRKRAEAITKDKAAPSAPQLKILKDYSTKPAKEQQQCRSQSESEARSMVDIILSQSSESTTSDTQQKLGLEYLAIQLAIRDRDELINILCHHQPDLLTSSVRQLVTSYEPIIRALHQAVDLSTGVSDLQAFLTDLIDISKVNANAEKQKTPSVEDFCRLLKKHQGSSHRFIHQVLKNGKELSQWYHDYGIHAVAQYKEENSSTPGEKNSESTGAGDFMPHLQSLMSNISDEDRSSVLGEINRHATFLSLLNEISTTNMKSTIRNMSAGKSELSHGPGMFLSRWQALIDETPMTPATSKGPVRSGASASVKDATMVDSDGVKKGKMSGDSGNGDGGTEPPNVSNTVRLLVPGFREILDHISDT